jgi:hypothetical protein
MRAERKAGAMLAEAAPHHGPGRGKKNSTLESFSVTPKESHRWQLVAAGIAASFSQRWAAEVEMPAALSAAVFVGLPALACRPPLACGALSSSRLSSPMRRNAHLLASAGKSKAAAARAG